METEESTASLVSGLAAGSDSPATGFCGKVIGEKPVAVGLAAIRIRLLRGLAADRSGFVSGFSWQRSFMAVSVSMSWCAPLPVG